MKTNFLGPFLSWLQGQGLPVETWLSDREVDPSVIGAREFFISHPIDCQLLNQAESETRERAHADRVPSDPRRLISVGGPTSLAR